MKITLNKIIPHPLSSINHEHDSIWGNFIELKEKKRIILNASSGKGKSTFTKISIGIRKDYEGQFLYDGINIRDFEPDDWIKIRQYKISVIFQDLQLFPKLTVQENLLLKNRLTDTYTEIELIQLLEKIEIDNKWNQRCGILSMGQQQRVAIIRAMCQPYKWLIMDEPFSHLDIYNKKNCMDLIEKRTSDQEAGFILTTLDEKHSYEYDKELKL